MPRAEFAPTSYPTLGSLSSLVGEVTGRTVQDAGVTADLVEVADNSTPKSSPENRIALDCVTGAELYTAAQNVSEDSDPVPARQGRPSLVVRVSLLSLGAGAIGEEKEVRMRSVSESRVSRDLAGAIRRSEPDSREVPGVINGRRYFGHRAALRLDRRLQVAEVESQPGDNGVVGFHRAIPARPANVLTPEGLGKARRDSDLARPEGIADGLKEIGCRRQLRTLPER